MNYVDFREIDGALFEELIIGGASELKKHLMEVNNLNVFPVPDGDTGDNMLRTIDGGISSMKELASTSIGDKSKALSRGMLLNARGNSGVILSQLFKGVSIGLKGKDKANIADLVEAAIQAYKTAYNAVIEPVEGTMLTVARESAEKAKEKITEETTLGEAGNLLVDEMKISLENTPELLAVLKEAGVVDSGGAGLLYLALGFRKVIHDIAIELDEDEFNYEEKAINSSVKGRKERKDFGTCAVVNGRGLIEVFKDLGADVILDGGQTNNTSTKDFMNAFDEINADHIFVFPNNSNIFLAAKQAKEMYTKSEIHIIESYNIGQAYAAFAMMDFSSNNVDEIIANFNDSMSMIQTAFISKAIRDANLNGVSIKLDDYFGFTDKTMLVSTPNKLETVFALFDKINVKNHEFLTLVYSDNVKEEEKQEIMSYLQSHYPMLEAYEINGGQDAYEFIIIAE